MMLNPKTYSKFPDKLNGNLKRLGFMKPDNINSFIRAGGPETEVKITSVSQG